MAAPGGFADRARRLEAAWVQLQEAIEQTVADGQLVGWQSAAFPVAWGWHRTIVRQGLACRVLADNDLAYETTAVRRSMLEHTIYLLVLAAEPEDMLEVLNVMHQHQAQQQLLATEAIGLDYRTPELDSFLQRNLPTNPLNRLAHTKDAAEHVGRQDLFAAWNSDSRSAHPSVVSARTFYSEDDATIELLDQPVDVGDMKHLALAINLLCLTDATDALNRLSDRLPLTAAIELARRPLLELDL